MRIPFLERITVEKTLIYILIFAVVIVFGFLFYLFFSQFTKGIKITSPVGGEEWEIGQTYKISWKSRGVDKVGIVLFKGDEAKWIAKDIHAGIESYDWKIYPGQAYGDDYWVAVVEYPWQKGNAIGYSEAAFAIVYPKLETCEGTSLENEWAYLPSDRPNLRRVFMTEESYSGNLDGLDGADKKCQAEAQAQGFTGTWHAFLGGDSDQEVAIERLKKTPRKTEGVFIEAKPAANLIRGATCHRLLGKGLNEFLAKLSGLSVVNEDKFGKDFFENIVDVWIGRLDVSSKKNCTTIAAAVRSASAPLVERYSFTATCQNWTNGESFVQGYPVPLGHIKPSFPLCYTAEGRSTDAVASGGLSSGLTGGPVGNNAFTLSQGKNCDAFQKLLCIEE